MDGYDTSRIRPDSIEVESHPPTQRMWPVLLYPRETSCVPQSVRHTRCAHSCEVGLTNGYSTLGSAHEGTDARAACRLGLTKRSRQDRYLRRSLDLQSKSPA